jgi:hypothetical protein
VHFAILPNVTNWPRIQKVNGLGADASRDRSYDHLSQFVRAR